MAAGARRGGLWPLTLGHHTVSTDGNAAAAGYRAIWPRVMMTDELAYPINSRSQQPAAAAAAAAADAAEEAAARLDCTLGRR